MSHHNYAARTVRNINALSERVDPLVRQNFSTIIDLIDDAVHFYVAGCGFILDDDLKGLSGRYDMPRLPFPVITISTYVGVESAGVKPLLLLCVEQEDENGERLVYIQPFLDTVENGGFAPTLFRVCVDDTMQWDAKLSDMGLALKYVLLSNRTNRPMSPEEEELHAPLAQRAARIVLELLEALSCKNVSSEVLEKINPAINARRVRDGKLPLYETRILVVDAGKPTSGRSMGFGHHSSPRQHLRRGHIRRLPSGNIWVNACVVGSPEKGVIEKRYAVIA